MFSFLRSPAQDGTQVVPDRLQGSTLPQTELPDMHFGASILQVDILVKVFHSRSFKKIRVESKHLGALAPASCTEF